MMEKLSGSALLEHVMELSRRMGATRELQPLLPYAIDEVLKLVGAERGHIVLKQRDGTLDFRVSRYHSETDMPQVEDAISHSILEEVIHTGESLVLSNAMTDARFAQAYSVLYMRLRSVMCVPMKTPNSVIGAIYVENRSVQGRFHEGDLPPLELFANHAAVAIANAALNEELAQMNQKLQALDKLKNDLIVLVSHELRTPVSLLYGYMELFKDNPQMGVIDHLASSVDRVVRKVTEITDIFLVMSGQLNMEWGRTPIAVLISEVVAELEPICHQRQMIIELQDLDDLPPLPLDAEKMRQALANVIGNAVKYTPDGGVIRIAGSRTDSHVELRIQDSGIGIPVEEQARIFDIFYTLGSIQHHSTSQYAFRGGGLGLGLPIAKGFIEAHGGTIRIWSPYHNPEQMPGSICTITLPISGPGG